jgi:signal transduction histidine kinase
MGLPSDKQYLIAELSHQIGSPLAAIRNALYLASCRTDDPQLLRYLELADHEIITIASTLRLTRAVIEDVQESSDETAAPVAATRGAAA